MARAGTLLMTVDETQVSLLEDTQEYLRHLLEEQVPDSLLTAAWDEFYGLYDGLIRRYVAAHGLQGADADDCRQDIWSTVIGKLLHFERSPDRPGLRAWLYTVVRSRAMDLFRRRSRRESTTDSDVLISEVADAADAVGGGESDEERQWMRATLETALEALREQLSPRNFQIVRLRLLEDRSAADVAEEVGVTAEQVRYRYHRALKKLRSILSVLTGEPLGKTVRL